MHKWSSFILVFCFYFNLNESFTYVVGSFAIFVHFSYSFSYFTTRKKVRNYALANLHNFFFIVLVLSLVFVNNNNLKFMSNTDVI